MKVHFWGVRGSISTPITPQQIQAKITAIIQRITEKDIVTPEARERFISNLPDWQFGTVGGNTPCVSLRSSEGTEVVLDAGTGIRCYGKSIDTPQNKEYNLFFSHFHWDHIQGLPFFDKAYDPETTINIYSAFENAKEYLENQMQFTYFPVPFDSFTKKITFHKLEEGLEYKIGNLLVSICKMAHPGSSYSFAFKENGKKVVYATDVELKQEDYNDSESHNLVFKDANYLIIDSQYTVDEANLKVNWGHSAFCSVIDFAVHWNVKKIFLFHHEPTYSDKKLDAILQSARWYAKYIAHSDLQVYLSIENQEFET